MSSFQAPSSGFQFEGWKIIRSSFNFEELTGRGESLIISMSGSGIYKEKERKFILTMDFKIKLDTSDNFIISLTCESYFSFNETLVSDEKLWNYFCLNAPAIVFPYIRAYISTISINSNLQPAILIPTLNLTGLGEELRNNIKVVSDAN